MNRTQIKDEINFMTKGNEIMIRTINSPALTEQEKAKSHRLIKKFNKEIARLNLLLLKGN
jgi:hypothetical protein